MYNQLSDDRPRKLQSALDKLAHKERLIKAWEPVIEAAKALERKSRPNVALPALCTDEVVAVILAVRALLATQATEEP